MSYNTVYDPLVVKRWGSLPGKSDGGHSMHTRESKV